MSRNIKNYQRFPSHCRTLNVLSPILSTNYDFQMETDYRVEGCNRPVTAEKANLLSNLPPVLLISLKRYAFTASGMEKIQKKISFGRKLSIPAKYLVSGEQSAQYELIATCSHHGRGHGGVKNKLFLQCSMYLTIDWK